jgi:multiple sugar transport system substrate-binding protein
MRKWLAISTTMGLLLWLLIMAPACTKTPASNEFQGRNIRLRFMFWGDSAEVQTVRYYINQFEKKTPGVTVDLIHQPSSVYRDNLRIRMIGQDAPDVMYLGLEDFAGFAEDGFIAPVDEFIARDEEFNAGDYYQEVYQQFRYRGKLYGVAKDFASLVLYYNKDLFDKWEVPYPKTGWSWDDFLETSKNLTHTGNPGGRGDEYGIVLETWTGQWLPWIWQNGGRIVDEKQCKWLMGDPKYLDRNAEALQFLSDLIWKHKVAPSPSYTRNQGTSDVFKSGRAAMYTAGRWMCMQFKDIDRFEWDVVTLPRKEKAATCLFTVAYGISTQCRQKQAAWQLVKFLTGRDSQKAVANAGMAIPSMKDVAESKAFTSPKAFPKWLKIDHGANLRDIPVAKTPPRLVSWPEIRTRVSDRLQKVFNNRETAREALIALQRPMETIIAREARRRVARIEKNRQ